MNLKYLKIIKQIQNKPKKLSQKMIVNNYKDNVMNRV